MSTRWLRILLCATLLIGVADPAPATESRAPITIVVREASLAEVFEMLSREQQVNILLGPEVEGEVSVNLFEVSLDHAIRSIAGAAGFVVERRRGTYMILKREELGQDSANGATELRTFKIEYSDPEIVSEIVEKHLSRYGEVTELPERRLLIVEDLPDFVERIAQLLEEVDRQPQQIMIDAKILEVTLDENETFGIDWAKIIHSGDDVISVGVTGLTDGTPPTFFLSYLSDNLAVALEALDEKGRVRTLSTPALLALEHEEAEVVIGDRLGFRITTTINQVTTESVEFLESGVILRFTGSVDRNGRIVLKIHPEVSTGFITDGIPNQNTTEVTTTLRLDDGQRIFIAGLLRDRSTQSRSGIPLLMDVPWVGGLFARSEQLTLATETVVVVTAHVVAESREEISEERTRDIPVVEKFLLDRRRELDHSLGEPARAEEPEATP